MNTYYKVETKYRSGFLWDELKRLSTLKKAQNYIKAHKATDFAHYRYRIIYVSKKVVK